MTEGPVRRNEGDCNLSSNSAPSKIKQVTNSHSNHEGTACRTRLNSPMTVHHNPKTYPLVISTARDTSVEGWVCCTREPCLAVQAER